MLWVSNAPASHLGLALMAGRADDVDVLPFGRHERARAVLVLAELVHLRVIFDLRSRQPGPLFPRSSGIYLSRHSAIAIDGRGVDSGRIGTRWGSQVVGVGARRPLGFH